jgi:RNA polymerase sigma-70 factor, ECF subfamily
VKKNFKAHATILPLFATHYQIHFMSQLADRILVETFLLTRDETVFRLLYRRHEQALWRLALRLSNGNTTVGEDIVQDAWLRAVERLPQFRWESSLKTWLCGFVVNRCREFWKNEQADNRQLLPIEEAYFKTIDPLSKNHEKMDLETAFEALPAGYRAVLILHDVEGFKHEEIAVMLDIAVGTSKSQLSRARDALRGLLTDKIS